MDSKKCLFVGSNMTKYVLMNKYTGKYFSPIREDTSDINAAWLFSTLKSVRLFQNPNYRVMRAHFEVISLTNIPSTESSYGAQ